MKQKFEVVGDSIVHGFKKGQSFTADLGDDAVRYLIEGGHIVIAKAAKKKRYETAAIADEVETAVEKN